MTTAEMEQWAGEAERLHALATSGTVGAEMAAATLRLRGVEYVGALLAERDADVAALKREIVATRTSALAQGNAATVLLVGQSSLRAERDAERAEAEALRAIVEGRECAPTPDECRAHKDTFGWWLVQGRDGKPSVLVGFVTNTTIVRWWPLDATGRPTGWPTGGGG